MFTVLQLSPPRLVARFRSLGDARRYVEVRRATADYRIRDPGGHCVAKVFRPVRLELDDDSLALRGHT